LIVIDIDIILCSTTTCCFQVFDVGRVWSIGRVFSSEGSWVRLPL